MASGKTHEWVTLAFLPPVWMICRWGFQWSLWISALVTAGTFIGGFWLSPDLDTRSRPFYRWGLLRFIWWPYHWAVKHRSGLSHGILFASWLRLLYLAAAVALLYTAALLALAHWGGLSAISPRQDILRFAHAHLRDILWLGTGIWFGSLLHIALDALSSAIKIKGKRR
ncbi:MAG: putative metal-binding protein [Vampirovibrio sp.]|jgi:uncharacterized metal-binding protein|nr:putative metal-binding protein [Vampirovibrio sp.]